MDNINGFVVYPSSVYQAGQAITEAVSTYNNSRQGQLKTWEENDISGRPLTAPIFTRIEAANLLIADVTRVNFNVTFEIGYAIANGVRVFLIRNKEFESHEEIFRKIGIFDTFGYETYANADELFEIVSGIRDLTAIPVDSQIRRDQPVYILETPVRGHITTRIVSLIKKTRLPYRSFTPAEEGRLSPNAAIDHVSISLGVVIPLLSQEMRDAGIHNIRGAFVAGLSFGLRKETLILQDRQGPVPIDARDLAKTFEHPDDLNQHISDFSQNVYDRVWDNSTISASTGNLLSRLSVGDPMAENEFQSLGHYYVQTDEYGRALRGEVNLMVGRKGTGKTALFSQVRNKKRENRKNIVIDLKPEGYQLLKLKEEVLDYLSAGAKSHLISAFWEFLLYLEICYKILEKDRDVHLRDSSLYEGYKQLKVLYDENAIGTKGDFSERLLALSERIAYSYAFAYSETHETRLTTDQVTKLIHSQNIVELRKSIADYLRKKDEIWLLFDNLDKGWSPLGLKSGDIIILRCLLDAARTIQKDLSRDKIRFHSVIFIRNDVYQLLMDESPDFGKESRASLDWSDADLLREFLRKRLVYNELPNDAEFSEVWRQVCLPLFRGEETSQYLIDRSLMRPRNLLKAFQYCKSFAVNLSHEKIENEDLEKGVKAYSNDLLVDADQELTDVEPKAKNCIYEFIGENSIFSREELEILLYVSGTDSNVTDRIIEFLVYYGFLGIRYASENAQYIYDVGYDMQILRTRIKKNANAIAYVLNPAFWPALEIEA